MFPLLIACSTEPPAPEVDPLTDAQASRAAAALFCEAATNAGLECSADGAGAQLGERRVDTAVTVTSFVPLAGKTLGMGATRQQLPGEVQLGATLDLSVDGSSLLTISTTHAASHEDLAVARDTALEELLQRWMVGHGLAVIDALSGQVEAPALGAMGLKVPARQVGGFRAWAAWPMVSGVGLDPSTGGRMGPNVGSMLGALGPTIQDLEPGLHLVHVTATLGGPGGPGPCGILPPIAPVEGASVSMVRLEGQITVDGQPAGDICTLSEPVAWPLPQGDNSVEWQQVIVLDTAPAKAAEGEAEPGQGPG